MIYKIENNKFSVSINSQGAEIASIKSKKTAQEYIWKADPKIWASSAPVLFPIIGALKNNKYEYLEQEYSIAKHGFIRYNEKLETIEKTDTKLSLNIKSSSETLKMYPFSFEFNISFEIINSKLIVSHKVINTGNKDLLFSLGAHPAFKCPLSDDEKYEDYYLEFEENEKADSFILSKNGFKTNNTYLVLDNSKIISLTKTIFDNDALMFKDLKSSKISIKSTTNKKYITVSFADFNYMGIWAKPNAPFVCIEPWLGITDNENTSGKLEDKEGIITLAKHSEFRAEYSIEIFE